MSDETAAAEAASEGAAAPNPAEEKARSAGWRPKDEWRGDPERWVDAESFNKRGEEIHTIVSAENRRLKGELAEVRKTVEDLSKHHAKVYERALKDAERRLKEAVKVGDEAEATSAANEVADLKAAPPVRPQAGQRPVEPEVQAWAQRNEWFNRDAALRAFATEYHGQLLREQPGLSLAENLDDVTAEVRKRFPEKFGGQRKPGANAVEGGGAPGGKRGKSYSDLPAEAKAACDRFTKQKVMTREQYVAEYFGE